VNQQYVSNLLTRAHEMGNPTQLEIEDALRQCNNHAGQAEALLNHLTKPAWKRWFDIE
jgi:hypothetical protein